MADDPYAWRDPFDGIPSTEVAKVIGRARAEAHSEGYRAGARGTHAAAMARQQTHDEIVAYVASLHFKDTFEHEFLKLCMESMKFVALNGWRAP